MIESARRDGLDVHADAYPYTAYSTGITIFLEPWVLAGGAKQTLARLKESQQREKIRKAVAGRIKRDPGGPELIVISDVRSEKNRQLIGKDLQQIANRRNCDSAEAILQLIEEEKTQVSFIGHGMSEKNVEMVLTNGLVMLGSDGQSIAPTGRAGRSRPHPRSYGAFARMLDYYVRERKLLDLPTAIKKMTGTAADHAGIGAALLRVKKRIFWCSIPPK